MFEYMADLPTAHVDGSLISARISRVVEAIRDYDPSLDVQWIPPSARDSGDHAFRIIHTKPDGMQYVAFTVATEDEFDERVLKRIMVNDQRNGQIKLSEFEAHLKAQEDIKRRRYEDAWAEANDIAYHVFRTHKNTYKVNDHLTIKE